DAVDHEAVGAVFANVALQQIDARRQPEVGVAAQAVFRQAFERAVGIVAETAIVKSTHFGIAAGNDDSAFVVEHLPELAEARPVGWAFHYQAIALALHRALGSDRTKSQPDPVRNLFVQHAVILDSLARASEGGEYRPDVVHAAGVRINRRGLILRALQHPHEIVLCLSIKSQHFGES